MIFVQNVRPLCCDDGSHGVHVSAVGNHALHMARLSNNRCCVAALLQKSRHASYSRADTHRLTK